MPTAPLKITRKQLLLSLASLATASISATSVPARAGSNKKDKFSAQQKKDITKIHEDAEKKIFDVLTPEQKANQKEALKRGDVKPDVKLSDAQKSEIKKIRTEANQQTNAILGIQ
jgi:Spy/CpxP family protein refolding chaperone